MKIVHVVHLFHPATGGIETHVFHLGKEFVKNGHEVVVLTTKINEAPAQEELEGIKIKRFWSLNLPFVSSVNFSPGLFFELLRQNTDVYCSHGYGSLMPFFTSITAFLKGKPFIFTLHGYPRLTGILGLFQLLYKTFAASVFLRIVKRVIIVSKKSEEVIAKEVSPDKIVYVPNGVEYFEGGIKPFTEADSISYIGRLDEYKGIDVLIRAFAIVRTKNKDIKLKIIGKDEGMKEKLQNAAESLKVDAEFLEVPYSEVKEAYENSKAIVLPSKYEGFSMVWLESVNYERPIFSTLVGDAELFFENVYGKDAELFLFRNENELAEKLNCFLENEERFALIVKNAKEKLGKDYSWEEIAKRTLDIYYTKTIKSR
ncbi:glycosyltransferase family 4 protein [Candidatus Micrarchaeota archaeon]|nr:glycosyltransferase family 4 protein [Candidatus Micrarchaeota archaeon]